MTKQEEAYWKNVLVQLFGIEYAKQAWVEMEMQEQLFRKGVCRTFGDLDKYYAKYGTYQFKEGNSI